GVFPAVDFAASGSFLRRGGPGNRIRGHDRFDFELWDPSSGYGAAAACVHDAGGADGAGGRAMDLGVERFVSGCGFDHSFRGAVLDAGVAGGVSQVARAGAVAMAVWVEPDGRSD